MPRRAIQVRGIVQGVGFRPYVYALATRLGLGGFVRNDVGRVLIEVEGASGSLDQFVHELRRHPPPLARIESLSWRPRPARGERRFSIKPSQPRRAAQVYIAPDIAVCRACLAELFAPGDRRYRYPFINCTNCGPRLTIVTGAPYDRRRTTMAAFPMCPECEAEYHDPANRRFHAQPIACPRCGPRLSLLDAEGKSAPTSDPLAAFATALRQGTIGAMKGLGGYHLICDARCERAVHELRRRKQRDEKPLAIMVRDFRAAESLAEIGPLERELLLGPDAPIVLLKRRLASSGKSVAAAVAPGNPDLGIMLPYTPLHHLLLDALFPAPLVMTSGNRSDEPIAYADDEAVTRLAGIADLFLTHDRPIHVRCDDSVVRVVAGAASFLRRSRGFAPTPIRLPEPCPVPILAVGGQRKGTFALGCGQQAFVSHHLGDLDHFEAYRAFARDIALYENLFAVAPAAIAHDLHPDYASTQFAATSPLPLTPVQHHHAHLASCMAEHGLRTPVIGVTFDGAGLGSDGAIWGGEFLIGDFRGFHRAAHLRYVAMPGGEQAVREPWRMAAAHLIDAGEVVLLEHMAPPAALRNVRTMVERRFNAPFTSSMGRLFDAVAALAGIRHSVAYEGQAAMELEWLATGMPYQGVYSWGIIQGNACAAPRTPPGEWPAWTVDSRPLIRGVATDVAQGVSAATISRRFHSTIVELIADVCRLLRASSGLSQVALTGGVFMNALLCSETESLLSADGFEVYLHRRVPANDGGLSLGQLAVAAHVLASQKLAEE